MVPSRLPRAVAREGRAVGDVELAGHISTTTPGKSVGSERKLPRKRQGAQLEGESQPCPFSRPTKHKGSICVVQMEVARELSTLLTHELDRYSFASDERCAPGKRDGRYFGSATQRWTPQPSNPVLCAVVTHGPTTPRPAGPFSGVGHSKGMLLRGNHGWGNANVHLGVRCSATGKSRRSG
jgi:hypothetical protein